VSESELLTRAEALRVLAKTGCSKRVIEHCKTVSKFAVRVAQAFKEKGVSVNIQLVEIGGLLHDIGRSKTHTVDHGFIGGQIACSLGLPQSVVKAIERHVGGGIPKEEAKRLGWPARSYLPLTWEEKIVCYADKRVEGMRTVQIRQALESYVARLGRNHPAIDRIKKLHEEIVAMVGEL